MSLIKSKIYSLAGLKTAICISVIGGVILSSTRVLAASFVGNSLINEERLSLTVRQTTFLGGRDRLVLNRPDWAADFAINEIQGPRGGYDSLFIEVVLRHLTDPDPGDNGGGGQIRLNFFLDSRNARGLPKADPQSGSAPHAGRANHLDRARGVLTANIFTDQENSSSDILNWTLTLDASHNVPEPLTMLGAAAALGYGALLKRKYSENKKS
jgi:hypothetical protein